MTYRLKRGTDDRDQFGFYDVIGPVATACGVPPMHTTALTRAGVGWKAREVERWVVANSWAHQTERILMNVIDELQHNYEEAAALWKRYEEDLTRFRAAAKNDIVSLEAHARKTTEAVHKMQRAYQQVFETLQSEAMLTAIHNAERLATALASIQQVQTQRMTLIMSHARDDE